MVALHKPDRKAKLPAVIFTYTLGIISALIFGMGMCFAMGVIGGGGTKFLIIGILISLIGAVGMGVNYPLYKKKPAEGKRKYAFEIMELAKEISER